jgi:N6-L-threonylcarbamoyladenine synthase
MKKIGKYEILGETRDDAAGECFDKCAKILGLGYPGGPIISKLAAQAVIPSLTGNPVLPRPMMFTKDYDFSFSGLKTAVLYAWQKNKQRSGKFFASRQKTLQTQIAFAAEVQQAVIDVLIKKTMKAAKDYKAKTIILGGGVSANNELREQFENKMEKEVVVNFAGAKFPTTLDKPAVRLFVPRPDLSTDNALMAAITGFYHKKEKISPSAGSGRFLREIAADGNLRIK